MDIEKIKAALKPFSDAAKRFSTKEDYYLGDGIQLSDLRRAAEAYAALEASKPLIEGGGVEYDPASDDRWNAGVDFAMIQLCKILKVDPKSVNWDAATETLDGDVGSVIGNVLEKAMGDNWQDALSPALVKEGVVVPLEPTEAMVNAANDSMWESQGPLNPKGVEYALWVQVYRAMLAALPAPVQEQKTTITYPKEMLPVHDDEAEVVIVEPRKQ